MTNESTNFFSKCSYLYFPWTVDLFLYINICGLQISLFPYLCSSRLDNLLLTLFFSAVITSYRVRVSQRQKYTQFGFERVYPVRPFDSIPEMGQPPRRKSRMHVAGSTIFLREALAVTNLIMCV